MNETLIIWPFWRKLFLRFFFLFFAMFILIVPVWLPIGAGLFEWYMQPFQFAATWIGLHFFDLLTVNFDGQHSGDTTGNYLLLLVISSLALAGGSIWSVIDKQRKNDEQLFYWLIVLLRCILMATMILYGFAKLFKTQFAYPSPERLKETYGQSSPMTLAWTFLGYSSTYNYFMALAELGCVPLLFFRRTTLLGGMLSLVVAANIMAINYCFDVPVKILSTMLVVMSLFIIAWKAKRLFAFFFFNQAILPENLTQPPFKNKWKTQALISAKYLLLAGFLIYNIWGNLRLVTMLNSNKEPDRLLGYYNVIETNEQKPLKANAVPFKWEEVTITADAINVKATGQEPINFPYKNDIKNHQLVLFKDTAAKPLGEITYQYIEPNILLLKGNVDNKKIDLRLDLHEWAETLLIRRGFHWVNEEPYRK